MRRQSPLLVAGLIAGLLGAGLVLSYVRSVESRSASGGRMVTVLVAQREIAAGTPASAARSAVKPQRIPHRYAPSGAIADVDQISGSVALDRISRGETLLGTHFGTAARSGGALAIPRGMEAVAVTAKLDSGLGSYLRPGDRVGVYATFKPGGNPFTRRILSNVEVLAVRAGTAGGDRFTGSRAPQTGDQLFVLAVTPREAARLIFGKEVGSIWLTLVPAGQRSGAVPDTTLRTRSGGEAR